MSRLGGNGNGNGNGRSIRRKRRAPRREPLAIIGIGVRLPGDANTPEDFWKLLKDGVDAVSEIPTDRWNIKSFYDSKPGTPGKTNACRGGFIKRIDAFDAGFFGISPREAARMDPQQRILLEVAWEALEDAGQIVGDLAGSNTGVFIGLSSSDYMMLQQSGDLDGIDAHTNTGGAMSIAANRISYCLNLQGPSIALDTACSSSLVAVHQACQSIWEGDSRMALAGGVNVLIKPEPYVGFSRLSMLSPDGQCRAFAASANGFVRSEGAAIVVLKRLSDALADGDPIYALVRSSAVNQDGHTTGLTVPSEEAQTTLVHEACKLAGVRPSQIQFVEAHGPGTLVGDPIEARALGTVLATRERDRDCLLGSVKTNIGHLEPAAGIAGLVKVALALKHGEIPRNLHYDAPNPDIPFHKLKLRVPTSSESWSYEDGAPLAGVNSFGFGGTNSHVILQGAGDVPTSARPAARVERELRIIPLSARSPEALKALSLSYAEYLEGDGRDVSLEDIAHTTSLRRDHHDRRLAVVARSKEELVEQLRAHAAGEARPGLVSGRVAPTERQKIVFVCSGQGPQWWAMGRQLLEKEPVFREMIERCDAIVRKLGPWSLLEELTAEDEASSRMQKTSIAQPAILAIQVALAKLWESWGIRPEAVVGHSVGEVAAAYLAGVFKLEDAVRVIYHRGRCMDFASAYGKMLAVSLPLDEAKRLVRGKEDRISLAAHNSPTSVTLSGDGATLEDIALDLERRNVYCKFLRVEYAFHSPQMDPMQDALLEALAGLEPRKAELPIYSTVTGRRAQGKRMNAEYWWQNVRQYVRFTPAIDALLDEGYNVFVELAPHPVLSGSINESVHQRRGKVTVTHSLRRNEDEQHSMLKALGVLHTVGCPVDWSALAAGGRVARLPGYAWQHESFWYEGEESKRFRTGQPAHPLLGRRMPAARPTWQNRVDSRVTRYLGDHKVQGSVLLSGTSYLEMALAAAKELYGPGAYAVEEVELGKACFLPEAAATTLQLVVNTDESSFSIHSQPRENGNAWTDHVSGKVRLYEANGTNGHTVSLDQIRGRCTQEVQHEACYEQLAQIGLDYGPTFKGIESLWSGDREALGRIRVPQELSGELEGYLVHPAVLDACFQVITGTLPNGKNGAHEGGNGEGHGANGENGKNGGSVYLPVEFGQVKVHGPVRGAVWSHARLVEECGKSVIAEVDVLDESGNPLLEVRGFRCQAIEENRAASTDEKTNELVYEYQWLLSPRPGQAAARRSAAHLVAPEAIQRETAIEARRLAQEQGTEVGSPGTELEFAL